MRYQIQTRFTPPFVQGSSTNALSAADASFLLDKPTLIYTPLSSDKISSAEFLYIDHKHGLENVYHLDELGIAIVDGVAWFWSCGKWESAPREQWAWKYLTAVDDDDIWQRLWAPVLLSSISTDYEPRKARLPLPLPSLSNTSDMPSGRAIAASRVFDLVCSEVNHPRSWYEPDDELSSYENRKLARTCRLVCRDWARRLPLGDPTLKVAEGAVWHRKHGEWRELPRRYWAWTLGPLEWWVERRQQDNVEWNRRRKCKVWYPKLIRPIDDTMLSKGEGRWTISPLRATKKRFHTHLEPSIGRRFLENVHDLDDRELYRTCRLVCREWAGRHPVSNPELCNLKFSRGTMWYWTVGDWHLLPNKYWAWTFEGPVEWWAGRRRRGLRCKVWYPKLIHDVDESIVESYTSRTIHLPLQRRNLSDTRIRDKSAVMKMIVSWTFGFLRCADQETRSWKDTPSYADRKLARSCRLVCREWARRLPLRNPRLKVAEGAVWYRSDNEWRYLPKSYWAWTHQGLEWWMEKSQLDNQGRRERDECKAWYPRLIRPVDDLIRSRGKDRSMPSSVAITTKPSRTHLEASIGPRFLENIHDMGCRALYRTCRLVCRDWARRYPFRNRERIRLMHSGGVALYWSEGNWRVLPNAYWVWAFEKVDWWAERQHSDFLPHKHMGRECWGKNWIMKLVQPVDDCIGQDLSNALFPARRHRRTESVASALPPELFRYICNAADWNSWSFRLVCRYWNRQCTPHIFPYIDISSPERIRALSQFKRDPKCRFVPHVKMVYDVPEYKEDTSKFPWLHLLTQMSRSVGFAWQDEDDDGNSIVIRGPFDGGHQTIRSIHFGLPRSLPRSFSREIWVLKLHRIRFRRFDDLANLVCELPDLETLRCEDVSFTSNPTDLAHRRPRRCRNNLQRVSLSQMTADPASEEQPAVPLPVLLVGLSLYLSVYDVASFFSENEIAASIALMQPYREHHSMFYTYTDENSNSRKLILGMEGGHDYSVSLYSSQNTLKLGLTLDITYALEAWKEADWQRFDDMFRTSRSQMPTVPIHAIFGFGKREEMLEFAEAVPSRMPAVAGVTTLNYAMKRYHDERWVWEWYQASLDSEELYGELKERLSDVYPIEALGSEDMDSKDMDSEDSDSN